MSKILTLAATGLAGLVLGAGIGIAGAGQGTDPSPPLTVDLESMEEMHAAMRDLLPPDLAEQHDEMHATMGEHMADVDHGSMIGSMGTTMGGFGAAMSGNHTEHDPGAEG